ncbi:MAG: hypothetical protein ACREBU_07460 [Nitrososphaera sp.]
MVFPLIALGVAVGLDFLFQYYFEQEEKKRQEQYLAQGFAPEDVVAADVYAEGEEELFGTGAMSDTDPGAAYLRSQLFG